MCVAMEGGMREKDDDIGRENKRVGEYAFVHRRDR